MFSVNIGVNPLRCNFELNRDSVSASVCLSQDKHHQMHIILLPEEKPRLMHNVMFQVALPEEKPRLMHNVWSPDNLLQGVELGLDIFDSSYPFCYIQLLDYIFTKVGQSSY